MVLSASNKFTAVGLASKNKLPELVLITYYGRSGSYFLHSLLDGAEGVASLPCELYFLWSMLKKHEKSDEGRFEEVLYTELFQYYFEEKKHQGLLVTGSVTGDFEAFVLLYRQFLKDHAVTNDVSMARFIAIHFAFFFSRGGKGSIDKILYQLHVPCVGVLFEIMGKFPGTKHIQMIREPIATLCSLVKVHSQSLPNERDFSYIANDILYGGLDISVNGSVSAGVKLETLHEQPDLTMRKVAEFLGLKFRDTFLEETMLGRPWGSAKGFTSGFDAARTRENNLKHKNIITAFDEERLKSLLYSRYEIWGYEANSGAKIDYREMKELLKYRFAFENMSPELIQKIDSSSRLREKERSLSVRSPVENFKLHYLARNDIPAFQILDLL